MTKFRSALGRADGFSDRIGSGLSYAAPVPVVGEVSERGEGISDGDGRSPSDAAACAVSSGA